METLTPTDLLLVESKSIVVVDLKKVMDAYAKDGKKKISVSPVKVGKKPVGLKLIGTLTGENISVSDFGTESHSVGFAFEDEEDLAALIRLNEELFEEVNGFDDTWEINDIVKEDKIYLKFKFDKNKTRYNFKSNVKLSPKAPTTADIHRHDAVDVLAEFSLYFHLEDKKCGVMFTVTKFDVVKDEPPVVVESLVDIEASETPAKKAKRQKKE